MLRLVTPCVLVPLLVPAAPRLEDPHDTGFDTITEDDVEAWLHELCTSPLEGRDSPSLGLEVAGDFLVERFEELGLESPEGIDEFRHPFSVSVSIPVESDCALSWSGPDGEGDDELAHGVDFVAAPGCNGEASGRLVFAGYGIVDDREKYDDLRGVDVGGRIVVILEGEPNHKRKFEGLEEVTERADLYNKLRDLHRERVAGVLVVRRFAGEDGADDDERPEVEGLGYRHTWSYWLTAPPAQPARIDFPVAEISLELASAMLGEDVAKLAERIDKSGKPASFETEDRRASVATRSAAGSATCHNVVGLLPGTDLADEYVVVGAHYDHVGVDPRGRIGFGADDNASGTSALIEIAEALVAAGPRRSVLLCAFAAEEDGLLGSAALAGDLPVSREAVVAMINLDMIGRGDAKEVAVLGTVENPELEGLLDRANRLGRTGIRKIVTGQGQELFQRSDHYSFHQVGIPVLFFFEGLPIEKNKDYHTWRDTLDKLDLEKIARTARLAYNAAWLLANDDDRPPAPER